MKKQVLSLAALVLTASAFAQVENDDMYFNSKDRAALKAQKASKESSLTMASAKKTKKVEQVAPVEEVVNPTDSYSARNVNPEYAARSNSQTAAADNQDYFVNNYQYNTSSNLNKWNSSFNGWYSNSWYNANYFYPNIYGWNSSYYGSAYDPYGNPWCNPYYQSGWSSSFSYYWGNSWNYGWGGGIGMSYAYGNPYSYGSPWGYSGLGYGYPYYGSGYGYYPGNIIIVNNNYGYGENGRKVVYGKRASHGGMVTSPQDSYVAPSRSDYPTSIRNGATGGRVAATSGRQEDYYNRSWRGSQQQSYPSRNSSKNSWDNSSWNNNNSNGSWNNNGSSRSSHDSNSYSPSSGGGGGSRQSAPSGGGSNGRSRGRD